MKKQVDKSHYDFNTYMGKARWNSIYHQIDEVMKLKPDNVLEIGPGPGIFKAAGNVFGLNIKTLDIDPELQPDYTCSVFEMPFDDDFFDVVCAFQMLEHLPYQESLLAFKEMSRVSKKGVIISLPDAKNNQTFVKLPKIGSFLLVNPLFYLKGGYPKEHTFNGEHYWEINKKGFLLKKIIKDFSEFDLVLNRTFRVLEKPSHRFFIFYHSN